MLRLPAHIKLAIAAPFAGAAALYGALLIPIGLAPLVGGERSLFELPRLVLWSVVAISLMAPALLWIAILLRTKRQPVLFWVASQLLAVATAAGLILMVD